MSPRRNRLGPSGRALDVGDVVDRCRVERVLTVREGRYTLAEATTPAGATITVEVAARPLADKDLRRRAIRLTKMRRSIDHPNLLPLLSNGRGARTLRWGKAPANAITLAERLQAGRLEPAAAVTLLSQVAGGLETAARRGLLHRELAPNDILVTAEDPPRALITGFGLSVADAPGCRDRGSVADADYLSPEEIRGQAPRPESAVYSLACILVTCLTGSPPYPYDRSLLALHAHLVEEPPRVSERNPRLPAELDAVIAKALHKDPNRRHRSPVGLMRAAQKALAVDAELPVPGLAPLPPLRPVPARPTPAPPEPPAAPAPPAPPASAPPAPPRPAAPRRPVPAARAKPPATSKPPAPAKAPAAPKPPRPPRKRASGSSTKWRAKNRPTGRREAAPPRKPAPRRTPARQPAADAQRPRGEHQTSPRRKRSLLRRLAPGWSAIALLASALAGFAAGSGGADPRTTNATPPIEPPVMEETTPVREPPAVRPVVRKLAKQRTTGRMQLAKAKRPGDQARAADRLASAYHVAHVRLGRLPGAKTKQRRALDRELRFVEDAYSDLAAAASRQRPRAWRAASSDVRARERDLELLLRIGRWG